VSPASGDAEKVPYLAADGHRNLAALGVAAVVTLVAFFTYGAFARVRFTADTVAVTAFVFWIAYSVAFLVMTHALLGRVDRRTLARWITATAGPIRTLPTINAQWSVLATIAVGAVLVLPRREGAPAEGSAPVLQIGLVIVAILLISISSLVTGSTPLAVALLLLAALTIVALARVEAGAAHPLLPEGTLSPGRVLGTLFGMILLLGISITSDIFAPLFFQRLHGLSPLWAGYLTALLALGWTIAAVVSSGFTGGRVRGAIIASPIVIALGTAGLAIALATANPSGEIGPIALASACLFAMGCGIGIAFQHLSTRVLASGTAADNDRVSATLGMVQLFASGIGAAIGGVIVNAAGLPQAVDVAGAVAPARWLYGIFALITAIAIPFALGVVRSEPHAEPQAAE